MSLLLWCADQLKNLSNILDLGYQSIIVVPDGKGEVSSVNVCVVAAYGLILILFLLSAWVCRLLLNLSCEEHGKI